MRFAGKQLMSVLVIACFVAACAAGPQPASAPPPQSAAPQSITPMPPSPTPVPPSPTPVPPSPTPVTPTPTEPSAPSPTISVRHAITDLVKLDDITMYYAAYGEGEPLILLHGALNSADIWAKQVPELAQQYRVITPDLRGQGRTTDSAAPYTYKLLAEDIVGLMDHLKIDKANVVGWEMGAITGLELARTHPERVNALVAYGGWMNPKGLQQSVTDWIRTATTQALIEDMSYDYRAISATPDHLPVMLEKVRQLLLTQPNMTPSQLVSIQPPTLLLAGKADEILDADQVQAMATAMPQATFTLMPGVGHYALNSRRLTSTRSCSTLSKISSDGLGACIRTANALAQHADFAGNNVTTLAGQCDSHTVGCGYRESGSSRGLAVLTGLQIPSNSESLASRTAAPNPLLRVPHDAGIATYPQPVVESSLHSRLPTTDRRARPGCMAGPMTRSAWLDRQANYTPTVRVSGLKGAGCMRTSQSKGRCEHADDNTARSARWEITRRG